MKSHGLQEDEEERCAICSGLPEDILMLECNHDICVDCALKGYSRNKPPHSPNLFVCSLCHRKTSLDKETISFLQAALEEKRAEMQDKPHRQPPIPKAPKEKNRRVCVQHREQLIYYCFDCQVDDICAECMLGDKHLNHNVCTLKKAIQKLKTVAINELKERQAAKAKLHNYQKSLKELNSNFKNHIQSKKKEIKYYFDSLSQIIENHYDRVSQQLQDITYQSENTLLAEISRNANGIESVTLEMEELKKIINSELLTIPHIKRWTDKLATDCIKIEHILPEFEYIDISTELNKRLAGFWVNPNMAQSRQQLNELQESNTHQETRVKSFGHPSQPQSQLKQSYVETPLKSEMHRSIHTASDLIKRLQSRQKGFS